MRKAIAVSVGVVVLMSLALGQCAPGPTPTPEVIEKTVEVEKTVVVEVEKTVVVEPTPVPEEKPPWWVPEGEEVVLSYWMNMPEKEASTRAELERFEEEHPRIKVDLIANPGAEALAKFRSALSAGNPPDVVLLVSDASWDYGDQGELVDLGPFIKRDLNLDDFYPATLEHCWGCDGNWYSLPLNWVASVITYNKDLFDEAGLDYPDETWTWEDFKVAACELTKDTDGDGSIDQWGAFVAPDHLQGDPIIWSMGGRVYDPADNRVHFSDPKSVEALQFLADLILKDECAPPGSLVDGWSQARTRPIATGRVGMRINGSWMLGWFRDLTEFDWGIAPVPQGPEGRFSYFGADTLHITKKAEERGVTEQAWELVRWLVTPDGGISWYTAANPGHMPANRTIAESSQYKAAIADIQDHVDVIQYAAQFGKNPFTYGWREWRSKVNSVLSDAFNGQMSLEEAAQIADEEANAILEEWGECANYSTQPEP